MLLAFFLAMIITLPGMAAMRYLLSRRVSSMMKQTSPSVDAGALVRYREVPATTLPRLDVLDSESEVAASDVARRTEATEGRRLFFRWWLVESLGVIMLVGLFCVAAEQSVDLFYPLFTYYMFEYSESAGFAFSSSQTIYLPFSTGVGIDASAYMAIVTLRFLLYRRYYSGGGIRAARKRSFVRRWVTTLFEELFRVILHPRHSWFPFLIYAYLLLSSPTSEFNSGLPLIAIVAGLTIHAGMRVWLSYNAQRTINRRLLILRVFGRNQNSVLTFGALRDFWNYVGTSFTVVDRSYLAFKYRGHSEDHVSTVFFLMISIPLIMVSNGYPVMKYIFSSEGGAFGLFAAAAILLGGAVYLTAQYFRAPRYFASDRPHIRKMIDKVLRRPRRFWPLTFRSLDMHCYDNTWRVAVAEFIDVSDIVLMDLRGYSEQRRGCEYEVDFLFDSIQVERIVFLVDAENSLDLVETLVRRRWEQLSVDSPNLGRGDAVVTIYCSNDGRVNDMKGLINLLAARIEHAERLDAGARVAA